MASAEKFTKNNHFGGISNEQSRSHGFKSENVPDMCDPISKGILFTAFVHMVYNPVLEVPEKTEPAFVDKEIIMAALNIKSMDFNTTVLELSGEEKNIQPAESSPNGVTLLLDLAFASNVRYLDDHEMYLENIDMYKTLPFASGVVMARGLLDSLMSAAFFNASSLRLLRQLVIIGRRSRIKRRIFYC